ncbi:MAG: cysteine--tRNA ligase [Acidimicrobiia bacterium]|nr:cysteine--tRNA ligase [Acidimicrobiia bacterium]
MPVRLHNTETGALEELEPRRPGHVDIYVCGPTVYGPPHLGHARTVVSFDMIRRWLRRRNDVTFVSNYTDVDDKIIARARQEERTPEEVARTYEAVWLDTMRRLRVLDPDKTPRATEAIDRMVSMIAEIIARGHAYESGGDVYFDVSSFPTYGRLSHQGLDDLRVGARVEPGEHKRNPEDFALWKAAKPDEPSWDSPWGPGRPGWHIECSVMSTDEFGMGFDIHGGGSDLVFPHHENEIAQAEAATGTRPFVRHWLHSGMVNLAGEKMAKSTGNVVMLSDLLASHSAEAIRLLVAQTHYRHQLEFTEELVEECERAVDRLATFRDRLAAVLDVDPAAVTGPVLDPGAGSGLEVEPEAVAVDALVLAMDDDFGTPGAVAALFDMVKRANAELDTGRTDAALAWAAALAVFDEVLAVVPPVSDGNTDALVDGLVVLLLDIRQRARESRDFELADRVRSGLGELGIIVEDSAQGTRWRRGRRQAAGR